MRSVLVALTAFVAPGFAHGLLGQRKAMWIVVAATWLSLLTVVLTIYGVWLPVAATVGAAVHAGILHRRLRRRIMWDWMYPSLAFVIAILVAVGLRLFVLEAFKMPSSSMYPTLMLDDHIFIEKVFQSYDRGDIIVFRQPCEPDRDYIKRIIALGGDTVEIRCSVVYLNGRPLKRELVDANCSYEDFYEGYPDPFSNQRDEGRWETKGCSRYREAIEDHAYEIFQTPEQPTRDANRSEADQKDFPQDTLPRYCGNSDTVEGRRKKTNQAEGKVVVTKDNAFENPCALHMHYVVPEGHVFVMGDNRPNSNDSRYWGSVPVENIKGRPVGIWKPLSRFGGVR